MKNKFILLLLAVLAFGSSLLQLKAQDPVYQEFAPIGAKWWYDSESVETYVESIRDTVVVGQNGKILKIEKQIKNDSNLQEWEIVIYQDGNTIYYYVQDEFQILFDFALSEYEQCDYEFPATVSVWKEESIDVNGTELTRFFAIYNTIFFYFNFTIVEKIGGNLFLSCIDPELSNLGVLKCYEDNEIGMFCDENLWTELEETPSSFSVNIYPNPSIREFVVETNNISFTNIDNSYIEVIDNMGKSVNRIHLKQSTHKYHLNTLLTEGIYFVSLIVEGVLISNEKIIILN